MGAVPARAVLAAGRGPRRCTGPPPYPPRRGGLCATHPGDTVTIETTALHRVGKLVQCDSSPTCLAQSERRRGGGPAPAAPSARLHPKTGSGFAWDLRRLRRPLSLGLGAAHPHARLRITLGLGRAASPSAPPPAGTRCRRGGGSRIPSRQLCHPGLGPKLQGFY